MNKQELLDSIQAAKDHLDEAGADDGVTGYSQLVMAVAQLAVVLEQVLSALAESNERITRNFDYTQELVDSVVERLEG